MFRLGAAEWERAKAEARSQELEAGREYERLECAVNIPPRMDQVMAGETIDSWIEWTRNEVVAFGLPNLALFPEVPWNDGRLSELGLDQRERDRKLAFYTEVLCRNLTDFAARYTVLHRLPPSHRYAMKRYFLQRNSETSTVRLIDNVGASECTTSALATP